VHEQIQIHNIRIGKTCTVLRNSGQK